MYAQQQKGMGIPLVSDKRWSVIQEKLKARLGALDKGSGINWTGPTRNSVLLNFFLDCNMEDITSISKTRPISRHLDRTILDQ